MIKLKIKMSILLIVLLSLLYILLSYEKDDKITKYLHKTTKNYNAFYQSTYTQHKEQAMLIYKLLIQQDEIISIYYSTPISQDNFSKILIPS